MKNLLTLNDIKKIDDLISLLNDKHIIVYEDIQGSKIQVNWDGEKITIKPKSLNNDPISDIDLATQIYYQKAFDIFNNLSQDILDVMRTDQWFCFEYFPDEQPANIKYDRLPKNNLILIGIIKDVKDKKQTNKLEELKDQSDVFDTDVIPVIFTGKLTNEQLESIKSFIKTSYKDLEFIFSETNFSKFFYNLLSPNLNNSFLMDTFQSNLEKIIISIEDKQMTFQLLNPLYKKLNSGSSSEHVEIYSLILINFMEWLQLMDLDLVQLNSKSLEMGYIELMSELFNRYIEDVGDDINAIVFDIPDFFKSEKFKVNVNKLKNEITIGWIEDNPKFEYVFKILTSTFYKKRYKKVGLFTKQTLEIFNTIVDTLVSKVENSLNVANTAYLKKKGFLVFDDFLKMQSSVSDYKQPKTKTKTEDGIIPKNYIGTEINYKKSKK